MSNRDFKGVWIPKELYLHKSLSWTEKILLVEIDSLDKGEGCFASNEYLAKFLNKSAQHIADTISNLRKGGYIIDIKKDGRKRWISINPKADLGKTRKQPSDFPEHSNTVNNTKEKTPTPLKFDSLLSHDLDWLEELYDSYHKISGKPKSDKASCIREWKRLKPNEKTLAVDRHKAWINLQLAEYKDHRFVKKMYKYLKERRWEDISEVTTERKSYENERIETLEFLISNPATSSKDRLKYHEELNLLIK